MIGTEVVARAPADGYTALYALTQHIQNLSVFRTMTYDPIADFVPVARVLSVPTALAAPASLGVSTLAELVAKIKAEPGKHSFGSTGNASTGHIYGTLFAQKFGLDANHVPYRGAAPMITDFLAGRVSYTIVDIGTLAPHVGSGAAKLLAVAGTERMDQYPAVPTFAGQGVPGFEALSWMAVFLRRGVPDAVLRKWEDALRVNVGSDGFRTMLAGLSMKPDFLNSAGFSEQVVADAGRWREMIQVTKVTAE
jgi:tripartite-type tricarboxylate transporter receptor subunit TctC